MHLVHNDMRDPAELGIALQPPQQDACSAVQQPGGRRLAAQRGTTKEKCVFFHKGCHASAFASEAAVTRRVAPGEMFCVTLTLSRRIW